MNWLTPRVYAAKTQLARFAIEFERAWPDDFRQVAPREAPQTIHLPKPVLRGDVPLRDEGVFLAGCVDVRHAESIERYRGRRAYRHVHGAGALR